WLMAYGLWLNGGVNAVNPDASALAMEPSAMFARSTFVVFVLVAAAQTPGEPKWTHATPINDLPNPYSRDANWAHLPAGLKWGAVIGAEPGPDGNLYVVHRCFENSCAGRSEAPIFKFDRSGHVL